MMVNKAVGDSPNRSGVSPVDGSAPLSYTPISKGKTSEYIQEFSTLPDTQFSLWPQYLLIVSTAKDAICGGVDTGAVRQSSPPPCREFLPRGIDMKSATHPDSPARDLKTEFAVFGLKER